MNKEIDIDHILSHVKHAITYGHDLQLDWDLNELARAGLLPLHKHQIVSLINQKVDRNFVLFRNFWEILINKYNLIDLQSARKILRQAKINEKFFPDMVSYLNLEKAIKKRASQEECS